MVFEPSDKIGYTVYVPDLLGCISEGNTKEEAMATIKEAIDLYPEPLVEVTGSRHVDVIANRIDGKLAVNLVNTSGEHENEKIFVIDEIQPVGPLSVTIRSDRKPRSVALEPGGRNVSYTYSGGKIRFIIPRLEIHDIIVVEE
ncbi:type II toxin-antitoxin system HicB family antitoxin [Candidatus Latescibacterota bacterium]